MKPECKRYGLIILKMRTLLYFVLILQIFKHYLTRNRFLVFSMIFICSFYFFYSSSLLSESMARNNFFSKGPLLIVSNKSDKNSNQQIPELDEYFGISHLCPQFILDYKVNFESTLPNTCLFLDSYFHSNLASSILISF